MQLPTLMTVLTTTALLTAASMSTALSGRAVAASVPDPTVQAAIDRIGRSYLAEQDLEATVALSRAGSAAQAAVPWLLVDSLVVEGRQELRLSHGDTGPFARVAMPLSASLSDLPRALQAIIDAIEARSASSDDAWLPDGLDLPVELLRGVSRALDSHSVVLSGARLDDFNERIRGRLVGIGTDLVDRGGRVVISRVFPDSPAQGAGLLPDDVVTRVDAVSTTGMTADQVLARVRGPEDSAVKLEVLRLDPRSQDQVALSLSLLRTEVVVPNVAWDRSADGVGWIHIDHFSQQTVDLMVQALVDLSSPPAVAGIVLDLRGDAGGSMLQAAKTVDLFVDEGLILRTGGQDFQRVPGLIHQVMAWPDEPVVLDSAAQQLASQAPLVVLMDRGSASASEIVAGALSLLGRAILVGERSYGKGTVQQPFLLREATPDLSEVKLKLTIAEYHLSDDTRILPGVGLQPDLATQRIELSPLLISLPRASVAGDALGLVIEGRGWRAVVADIEGGDPELVLAREIVLASPDGGRDATLVAASQVLQTWRATESAQLRSALEAHGFDWSRSEPCSGPCDAPQVGVHVDLLGEARAGQPVTVRATVTNLGAAPLHRMIVRLGAASRALPWSDLTLPIGFLPPGESSMATVSLVLPMFGASRVDTVSVTVDTDRRPSVAADSADLRLVGQPTPAVQISVRGLASSDPDDGSVLAPLGQSSAPPAAGPPPVVVDTVQEGADSPQATAAELASSLGVEVTLRNDSTQDLTGVQVRLVHPDDSRLEPLERQVVVDRLDAGDQATVTLHSAWPEDEPRPTSLRLPLEVQAERYGTLLEATLPVSWVGSPVAAMPPQVDGMVPLQAPPGPLDVHLQALDDTGIHSVTAWWAGDKLAWHAGAGRILDLDLQLPIQWGSHALTVTVQDDDGVRTRRRWVIRAASDGDGVATP